MYMQPMIWFIGVVEDIFDPNKVGRVRVRCLGYHTEDKNALKKFVSRCNVIVHLAGVNRHEDPQVIYDTNIKLSNRLIEACNDSKSSPHIIYSSSTQEKNNTIYGKSKLDSRKLFEKWSKDKKSFFTSLTIPNVFGPFGKPYYNSFISTFCHQLTQQLLKLL